MGRLVDKPKLAKPRIEYVAPPIEMVENFARQVCTELAARSRDSCFTDAGTIKGFAAFLHILLTIEAKSRNRQASFDSSDEIEVNSTIIQTAECCNTPPS
jgi:hypothetical protein